MEIKIPLDTFIYLLDRAAERVERKDLESVLILAREHDDSPLKLDLAKHAAELLGVDLG